MRRQGGADGNKVYVAKVSKCNDGRSGGGVNENFVGDRMGLIGDGNKRRDSGRSGKPGSWASGKTGGRHTQTEKRQQERGTIQGCCWRATFGPRGSETLVRHGTLRHGFAHRSRRDSTGAKLCLKRRGRRNGSRRKGRFVKKEHLSVAI